MIGNLYCKAIFLRLIDHFLINEVEVSKIAAKIFDKLLYSYSLFFFVTITIFITKMLTFFDVFTAATRILSSTNEAIQHTNND